MLRLTLKYSHIIHVLLLLVLASVVTHYVFLTINRKLPNNSKMPFLDKIMDSNHLSRHSGKNRMSAQEYTFKTGSMGSVQFPPFVDSTDPNGPGEGGAAVYINKTLLNETRVTDAWARYRFNDYVSEIISIRRSLPDCRSDICKKYVENFNDTLPQCSVVIVFNNEAWTTLLRSVHSVLSRTPEHVLKEIILVDDNSDFDYLRDALDVYFNRFPKVQIIHSPQRIGLIKARLVGFDASSAPVVIFLDSHIECTPGWAESMLIRIAKNPRTVVFPFIPGISATDFGMQCIGDLGYYCSFLWSNLQFYWVPIPQREKDRRRDDTDAYRSPTMPGGLFAISREFFIKIGKFDPELAFWGGENLELSFKTWMCGGSMEMDACSHIGHVFRSGGSIQLDLSLVFKNAVRVAEVWMDDYKNYFHEMNNYQNMDPGNITDRLLLRQRLNCKSFGWYLKNVDPEKIVPHSMVYAGEIRSAEFPKCISSLPKDRPKLQSCSGQGRRQAWYMAKGEIFQNNAYLHVYNNSLILNVTDDTPFGPHWEYRKDLSLYHIPTDKCLTVDGVTDQLRTSPCTNATLQKWHFQKRRTDLTFPMYT